MEHRSVSVAPSLPQRRTCRATHQTSTHEDPRNARIPALFVALVLFLFLLPVGACKNPLSDMSGDWWHVDPTGWTQVSVRNSTADSISTQWDAYPIPVGAVSHVLGHSSGTPTFYNPNSIEVSRRSRPLARVTYKVLRYPPVTTPETWKAVVIDITQDSHGIIGAAVPDSSSTWVTIVSVQAL